MGAGFLGEVAFGGEPIAVRRQIHELMAHAAFFGDHRGDECSLVRRAADLAIGEPAKLVMQPKTLRREDPLQLCREINHLIFHVNPLNAFCPGGANKRG